MRASFYASRWLAPVLLLVALSVCPGSVSGREQGKTLEELRRELTAAYGGRIPHEWSETARDVRTRLKTTEKVVALTLDACGSRTGKGYDARLIEFLIRKRIPATLFVNARWIDANPAVFRELAANPLFEIANHGYLHRPASVNGRSAYGIAGTAGVAELVDEIELNARKVEEISGRRTRYYRSGTAFYDEIAVAVSRRLGHEVIGFSLLGDAGATLRRQQVKGALVAAKPGDIAILHMNHPEGETADGVIAAVPELEARGFRFVKLSDYDMF